MRHIGRSLLIIAACAAGLVFAQQRQSAPAKQTFMVPMRDGVKLATDVYLPQGEGPFPVVLTRTPYDKGRLPKRLLQELVKTIQGGYAVVNQDVRGRYASEGEKLPFEGDFGVRHQDGHDALEWIAKQPWCNGRIGTAGPSALGVTQLFMAPEAPSQLICQYIVVGPPSFYHDFMYPGGVFKKDVVEKWLLVQGYPPEALKNWTSHSSYDDYWREREVTNRYTKVNVPAVHIGSYYDLCPQGTIDAFLGYQTKGGSKARGTQKLIMGPWEHRVLVETSGEFKFKNAQGPPNQVHDRLRWFDYHLKGIDNGIAKEPAVTYYVMGDVSDPQAPGNEWRTADNWPPVKSTATHYYLHSDRTLSREKPKDGKPLAYTYDPSDPVPTVGGLQLTMPAGPRDQRTIENRPDVLVFTGEVMSEPVELTGRPQVRLWASSDAKDTDFFVKLCDVYPDGRSINICEGQLRARYRQSFSKEKLLEPGQVYQLVIDLSPTSIIVNKGHRLRLHVTSSSAPGFAPNPNTGEPFRASAKTQVAQNTVYVDARHPSHVMLPVAGR